VISGVLVALVVGVAAGFLNGFLVAKLRIPAILATLGTYEFFTGLAIVVTQGKPVSGMPPIYSALVGGKILGFLPVSTLIFAVAAVAVGFMLRRMSFGNKLYMVGTNPISAHFSGIGSFWLL